MLLRSRSKLHHRPFLKTEWGIDIGLYFDPKYVRTIKPSKWCHVIIHYWILQRFAGPNITEDKIPDQALTYM